MSTASSSKSTASSSKSTASSSKSKEIKFSKTIGEKCCDEAVLALFTPFVVCLAAGDLNIDSFRHFIAQDVHFLRAFVEAFQVAEDYADDDDAKDAIAHMRDTVSQELKTYDSFVQEWDSDLIKESPLNPATTKYIDFLSAITSGRIDVTKGAAAVLLCTPFEKTRIASYILGAIAPCMRRYLAIGRHLKKNKARRRNHPYMKWIDKYSSTSFEISAQLTEELLDKLCVYLTTNELDIVEKLYLQALRLGMEFLNAQTLPQTTGIPLCKELKPAEWHLLLFSAFDLAISMFDSSATLAQLSIETAAKLDQNQPGNQITAISSADVDQNLPDNQIIGTSSAEMKETWEAMKETWEAHSKKYKKEYERCVKAILQHKKGRKFRYNRLCQTLEYLSDFEKKATARVIKSGVLKGVNLEHINKVGGLLILRAGCSSFLQEVVQKENLHVNVHVLSSCWCGDLIRSAFSAGGLQAVNVQTNEFIYDNSSATGEITLNVESPFDKIKAFAKIFKGFKRNKKKKLTVYIGHSVRDLLCLLKADIGIVIGSDDSLRKVGHKFGVSFMPLFDGLVRKQIAWTEGSPLKWNRLSGVLYTASSWAEIRAFILGS